MKLSKRYLIVQIFYVILIFQIALQNSSIKFISIVFNYIDDAIAALCIIYVLWKVARGYKLEKLDSKIFRIYLLFIIIGFSGSILFRIQTINAVIFDFLTCSKFVFGYLAARIYCRKYNSLFVGKSLAKISKVITVIFFVLALNDEFLSPIFPIYDYRYFGRSIMLMYAHPTYLTSACIVMMAVLAVDDKKKNLKYLIMLSTIVLFTFRAKALSFVAVFWGIYLMRYVFRITSKIPYFISSAILAIYIGYDRFITYFYSSTWSARQTMFIDALGLAKKYFPIGAGFGTFGTNMSVVYYSKIYNQLGYGSIQGMSKATASYLNDGLWQAIIGQFGFLGTILFAIIIVLFFKISLMYQKKITPMRFVAIISLNIYLLIASIGEMAYFAPYAITMFLLLGAIIDENKLIGNSDKL